MVTRKDFHVHGLQEVHVLRLARSLAPVVCNLKYRIGERNLVQLVGAQCILHPVLMSGLVSGLVIGLAVFTGKDRDSMIDLHVFLLLDGPALVDVKDCKRTFPPLVQQCIDLIVATNLIPSLQRFDIIKLDVSLR
jgi:hypothetical protein